MGQIYSYLIAEVFLHKKNSRKNLIVRGPGNQSGTVNFFRCCFRKNLNCKQYIKGKRITFFGKKVPNNLQIVRDPNHPVGYMSFQIAAPSDEPNFLDKRKTH